MTLQFILIFASLSLALAVTAGAFGAHQLAGSISQKHMETWKTAVLYQLIHSLALLNIVAFRRFISTKKIFFIGIFIMLGIIFFSGSLYFLVLMPIKYIGIITPIGGLLLVTAWLLLAWEVIKNKNELL